MRLPVLLTRLFLVVLLTASGWVRAIARDAALGKDVNQLLLALASDWSSTHGTLYRFTRDGDGNWTRVAEPVPVLFGKRGLAWGRGVRGAEQRGHHKREGDGKTPAGLFALGTIYGNDAQLPPGADYPFHQVTSADAWPDDPKNPFYNRHVAIDPANPPPWFASQRMRTGDPAYRWRVEIRHNADPVVPGAGSATFFHIRRGPNRPSAACTTMPEPALHDIVVWLRASAHPHYALLTEADYHRLWQDWGLPAPTVLGKTP